MCQVHGAEYEQAVPAAAGAGHVSPHGAAHGLQGAVSVAVLPLAQARVWRADTTVLQDCLPDCDLITLLKAQPRYFFGSSEAGTVARISQNLDALEAALAAVTDVPQVVEERPELLFLEPQQLQESLDCISDLQLSTISPPDVAVLVLTFCRP